MIAINNSKQEQFDKFYEEAFNAYFDRLVEKEEEIIHRYSEYYSNYLLKNEEDEDYIKNTLKNIQTKQ